MEAALRKVDEAMFRRGLTSGWAGEKQHEVDVYKSAPDSSREVHASEARKSTSNPKTSLFSNRRPYMAGKLITRYGSAFGSEKT